MHVVSRWLLGVVESLVYGTGYGTLQYLIRSPEPLDPETTWNYVSRKLNPIEEFACRNWPLRFMRPLVVAAKLRQDHILGIADHYDVSNDFYELWLDKKYMFYTAGDFPTGEETLEEAQTIKANDLLDLIQPQAGEKILDLGSGWGAMLKRIYEVTGDKENLYGYNISKEQIEHNKTHHQFNVEFRNFITTDYPENFFDKIFEVESFVHARPNEIYTLAHKLFRALKPGGRLVHQIMVRIPEPIPATAAVVQIFFPGTIAMPYTHWIRAFEQAGFRITHQSIQDYRPTLRAWFDRLVANRERAIEIAGIPTYNRYLVYLPAAWRWYNDGIGLQTRMAMEKPLTTNQHRARAASQAASISTEKRAGELVGAGSN